MVGPEVKQKIIEILTAGIPAGMREELIADPQFREEALDPAIIKTEDLVREAVASERSRCVAIALSYAEQAITNGLVADSRAASAVAKAIERGDE